MEKETDKKIEEILNKHRTAIELQNIRAIPLPAYEKAHQDIVKELNTEVQKAVEEGVDKFTTWAIKHYKGDEENWGKLQRLVETYLQSLRNKE